MADFFRFPQTPHFSWLGGCAPRDDKVLSAHEQKVLLSKPVVVEEKLDGANLGLSLAHGELQAQNRGQYLQEPFSGQFSRLTAWLAQHSDGLHSVLAPNLIVFGEWCAARHSLDYAALPDWFVVFDVYDRQRERFWSSSRRNTLANQAGLAVVPEVWRGKASVAQLTQLVSKQPSSYRKGEMEGVVIRSESADWCEARAKLVRADFTQAIETHWRKRALEWNRVAAASDNSL